MNVFKLTREGRTDVIAQACGACGRVYALNDAFSERCCDPRCADCGAALPLKSGWTVCDGCRATRDAARKQECVAKATRVAEADYSGPLYVEDSPCGRDGYFADSDDLRERYDDEGVPLPDVVWACIQKPFTLPTADEIVERECENGEHYEDIADSLTDTDDLQRAITAWNARQTAESWEPDYRTLIVLDTMTPPERAPVLAVDRSRSTPDALPPTVAEGER
jgi:hypothetical protein